METERLLDINLKHAVMALALTLLLLVSLKSPLEALRIFNQKPVTFWFGKMTTGTLSPKGSAMFSDDPSVFFNSKMA